MCIRDRTQTGETAGKQKASAADQSVQQNQREIVVTTGLETDYYIEVQSDEPVSYTHLV